MRIPPRCARFRTDDAGYTGQTILSLRTRPVPAPRPRHAPDARYRPPAPEAAAVLRLRPDGGVHRRRAAVLRRVRLAGLLPADDGPVRGGGPPAGGGPGGGPAPDLQAEVSGPPPPAAPPIRSSR